MDYWKENPLGQNMQYNDLSAARLNKTISQGKQKIHKIKKIHKKNEMIKKTMFVCVYTPKCMISHIHMYTV